MPFDKIREAFQLVALKVALLKATVTTLPPIVGAGAEIPNTDNQGQVRSMVRDSLAASWQQVLD